MDWFLRPPGQVKLFPSLRSQETFIYDLNYLLLPSGGGPGLHSITKRHPVFLTNILSRA